MVKALLLLSGGLDSTLAGRILLKMGITIEAVNFTSPFCRCTPKSYGCSVATAAAEQLGIPVRIEVKGESYLDIVKHPRHGSGSGMNPCIDCRIFTFIRAKQLMAEVGADFIATGEVLGQRPMSQRKSAMALIERESGLERMVVRPLSAGLLPPSIPEEQGLVNRTELLSIQGRSRKDQIHLAETYELHDYPCPAGGCLLTDPEFSERLRELLQHEPAFTIADARLLSIGRHFRLPGGAKVMIGRNESENRRLETATEPGDWLLAAKDTPGATTLIRPLRPRRIVSADDMVLAARLTAQHTDGGTAQHLILREAMPDGLLCDKGILENVEPLSREASDVWRVGCARPSAVSVARGGNA